MFFLFLRVHENKTKTGRWGNSVLVAVVELETKYGLYFVELKLYAIDKISHVFKQYCVSLAGGRKT